MIDKYKNAGDFLRLTNQHLRNEVFPLMQEMEQVIDECDATNLARYIANLKALSDTFGLIAKASEQVGLRLLANDLEKRVNGKKVKEILNKLSHDEPTEKEAKLFIHAMKDIQNKTFN